MKRKMMAALLAGAMAVTGLMTGAVPVMAEEELSGEITFWHSFTQGARMDAIQAAADSWRYGGNRSYDRCSSGNGRGGAIR